jgi:hypothetical protein
VVKKTIYSVLKAQAVAARSSGRGKACDENYNSKFNLYGVRGAALERNLIRQWECYIRANFVMLPFGLPSD